MENDKLIELEKELARKDKIILTCMWVIIALSLVFFLGGILAINFLMPGGVGQLLLIIALCVLFLIPCLYALKLEVSIGAYECKECGEKIVPTYKQVLNAMHIGMTRYLKCPNCKKRTWCKKVLK